MPSHPIYQGEFLTLFCGTTTQAGAALNVSSGYSSVVKIKENQTDVDASAVLDIDSVSEASRFAFGSTGVTADIITSAESNSAGGIFTPRNYYYGWWLKETSSGDEYLIEEGTIIVKRSTVIAKS